MVYYINGKSGGCSREIAGCLEKCIEQCEKYWDSLVIVCIGSDRITGDSFGPFVGYFLSEYPLRGVTVYGTLTEPVHALNLEETLRKIRQTHFAPLILAVDASLGQKKHLGCLTVGCGSLSPGAGVGKHLPSVGDVFLTGIVSLSGFMEQLSLQNTRLAAVVPLARAVTDGILCLYRSYYRRFLPVREAFFQFPDGCGRRRSGTNPFPFAASGDEIR